MYLCVEDMNFPSFYDLCAEDIGFTSFYVFVVKPISSTQKYIEKGKTDILNTQAHRKR
jgi:hypothetical protein